MHAEGNVPSFVQRAVCYGKAAGEQQVRSLHEADGLCKER
jgi:hypothetical protein